MKYVLTMTIGLAAVVLSSGCSFNRAVINPGASSRDLSGIKVGQTTFYQVLDKLGPPGAPSEAGDVTRVISERHLRYVTVEQKTVRFVPLVYLFLPFKWADAQTIDELFVEFDDSGVVSNVYKTQRGTIWTPLQSEDKRESVHFEDLTVRLK